MTLRGRAGYTLGFPVISSLQTVWERSERSSRDVKLFYRLNTFELFLYDYNVERGARRHDGGCLQSYHIDRPG